MSDTLRDTLRTTLCAGASLDTNGHMGCVPVSGQSYPPYTLPGFYTQNLRDTATGCFRNLVIMLTVNDTMRDTLQRIICPGAVLTVNGVQYSNDGFYSQLLRDAATGCYSRRYIRVFVSDTVRDTIYRTVCAGAVFDTGGVQYSTTGMYSQLVRNATTDCFSRLYIDLTVNDTLRDSVCRTICAGASFDTGDVSYSRTGDYWHLFRDTATGCFTSLKISLSVNDTLRDTVHRAICAGGVFDTGGVQYMRAGFYSQLWRDSVTRCYKRLYIRLAVNDTLRDTIHRAICAGARFDTNGHGYTSTGHYSQLLRNTVSGCYSRLFINLTVHDTFCHIIRSEVCAGATFTHAGHSYSLQGDYLQRYTTVYGCDSLVKIHLVVNDTIRDTLHSNICSGQTYGINGQSYSVAGWYRQKLRTQDGCDSVLHIHLTVSDTIRDTLYFSVCAGTQVDVNGRSYGRQGWYRQYLQTVGGCDSIVHIFLFVDTPTNLQAFYKMSPRTISDNGMQMTFRDYSKGNVYDRKWIFHEIPDRYPDKEVQHSTTAYYTPHIESDSLLVTLVVSTFVGCTDSSKTVYPILKGNVWVPNAFTPDAENNRLLQVGHHNINSYEISMYNRAGLRVFHSTDPDESWDGTHRGSPCPAATYVYIINYTTNSQPEVTRMQKGTVLLVR